MTQNEYRRLSWDIYKWIRKNDPDLSLQVNRDIYSIAERFMVEYHIQMSMDDKNSYNEVRKAIEKLADMENKYNHKTFVLTDDIVVRFLNHSQR